MAAVTDPIPLEMEPMLAAPQDALPQGGEWEYEPKWDGFRTLVHRDGERVTLISRGARDMTRYFPELLGPIRALPPSQFVLDGEIIVVTRDGLDFDALQQRIHPADSRVRMLAEKTPASFVAFDLIALEGADLRGEPLGERRQRLEKVLRDARPPVHVTPSTDDVDTAEDWFRVFEGAGLDGVIAKSRAQPYVPGKRLWVKYKHERTCDCVVIGWRWDKRREALGSLLLGLYDDGGELHYVGHTSSFDAKTRRELRERLEPLQMEVPENARGRMPGGLSRWSRGQESADWQSVRPELVCEVAYEKLQSGERFRHAARFLRWRPDKPPKDCRFDQIESVAAFNVASIFG
ncbi:MAG TPA: ATP-dependent DNA ligase [Candidatus Dormibacteraeota bacterium]